MNSKCIVLLCENHKEKGTFKGDLCAPCYDFIVYKKGRFSQAYRNTWNEYLVKEEIDFLADKILKYQECSSEASGVYEFAKAVVDMVNGK